MREEYWSELGTPDDETRAEIYWPVATPAKDDDELLVTA